MRAVMSIASSTVIASAVLDGYIALWHPYSGSLDLTTFLAVLASVFCLVVPVFLFLVIPVFIWLRRAQRRVVASRFHWRLADGCISDVAFHMDFSVAVDYSVDALRHFGWGSWSFSLCETHI